jgi:hypothetical protein
MFSILAIVEMRTGNQGKVLMGGTKHGRTIPDIHLVDIFYLGDHGNANKGSVEYNPRRKVRSLAAVQTSEDGSG